jgi:hypothetical protein
VTKNATCGLAALGINNNRDAIEAISTPSSIPRSNTPANATIAIQNSQTLMADQFEKNNLRRRSFYEIVEQAKLPRTRLHDLRHTHATLLLSAGLNPKILSERLGHSSIRITLNLYGHVVPSMQKEATQALEELFRPRASAPYATLMLDRVDGEQNGEAHEVLFHGLLTGDADRARTDDLLRDRQAL